MLEKLSDHRVDELWAGVRKAPSRKEIEALAGELRERRHAESVPPVNVPHHRIVIAARNSNARNVTRR